MAVTFRLAMWLSVPCMAVAVSAFIGRADEPYNSKNYVTPARHRADEPLAKKFSLQKAAQYLDGVGLSWGCFVCHTKYPYLYARPMMSADDPAPQEIRRALESSVKQKLNSRGFRYGEEVAAAAAMAINDSITTRKLHPLTRRMLDHLWKVQKKDGSFFWTGESPPLLAGHYGVMLASIAAGAAPDDYAKTPPAQKGLARIRKWLDDHPPADLHQAAMLLWPASYHDGFLTSEQKAKTLMALRQKQLSDGAWSLPSFGNWKQDDGTIHNPRVGDGYATGFCVFVMHKAGVAADDPAIMRGLAWLKSNQRESGRWYTQSYYRNGQSQGLTNLGSIFAVMAIQSCAKAGPATPTQASAK